MSNYPWFARYPKGIAHEINPDEYKNVVEILTQAVDKYPNNTAFINMDKSITFKELDVLSDQFAAYLQNKTDLQKGDRVVIQMPNLLQYPVAIFGILKAGMVVVNTNPLYTPREMEHQFKDSGAKAIIILSNFACNLEKVIKNTEIKTVIVTKIGDMLGGLKGGIVNFVVKNVKKMVPPYSLPSAISYKQVLKEGASLKLKPVDLTGDDTVFLQYTGGTTGVSKGATLSHRNICANVVQIGEWMMPSLKKGTEMIVTALPLYHIFALSANTLTMMHLGASNLLVTNPRDMPAFIKDLKKYQFSVFTGVNTLFNGLLNQEEFHKVDFSKLKICVGGGMAVQSYVAKEWEKVTGCSLAEGYGLSETSPVLAVNPVDGTEKMGTAGLPVSSTEVVILSDEGNPVPQGEIGEICAKGPQIMSGYWNRPKETANVFINGYFRTGDMGLIDDEGFVKIVDRKKEMILVSGFNVYPNEVEDVVSSMEKVNEVAAIGVPDPKSTEAVKIFVIKGDPSLTEQEILDYCKENMTAYKRPRHIEFRDELPKSNVGKILRRVLKEEEMAKTKKANV